MCGFPVCLVSFLINVITSHFVGLNFPNKKKKCIVGSSICGFNLSKIHQGWPGDASSESQVIVKSEVLCHTKLIREILHEIWSLVAIKTR
jgi:hypothetical protein